MIYKIIVIVLFGAFMYYFATWAFSGVTPW